MAAKDPSNIPSNKLPEDLRDLPTRAWINYGIEKAVKQGITVKNNAKFSTVMDNCRLGIERLLKNAASANSYYEIYRYLKKWDGTGVDWPSLTDPWQWLKPVIMQSLLQEMADYAGRNLDGFIATLGWLKGYLPKPWPELAVIDQWLARNATAGKPYDDRVDIDESTIPQLVAKFDQHLEDGFLIGTMNLINDHPELISHVKDNPRLHSLIQEHESYFKNWMVSTMRLAAWEAAKRMANILKTCGAGWSWLDDIWGTYKTIIIKELLTRMAQKDVYSALNAQEFKDISNTNWPEIESILKGAKDLGYTRGTSDHVKRINEDDQLGETLNIYHAHELRKLINQTAEDLENNPYSKSIVSLIYTMTGPIWRLSNKEVVKYLTPIKEVILAKLAKNFATGMLYRSLDDSYVLVNHGAFEEEIPEIIQAHKTDIIKTCLSKLTKDDQDSYTSLSLAISRLRNLGADWPELSVIENSANHEIGNKIDEAEDIDRPLSREAAIRRQFDRYLRDLKAELLDDSDNYWPYDIANTLEDIGLRELRPTTDQFNEFKILLNQNKSKVLHSILHELAQKKFPELVSTQLDALNKFGIYWPELDTIKRSILAGQDELDEDDSELPFELTWLDKKRLSDFNRELRNGNLGAIPLIIGYFSSQAHYSNEKISKILEKEAFYIKEWFDKAVRSIKDPSRVAWYINDLMELVLIGADWPSIRTMLNENKDHIMRILLENLRNFATRFPEIPMVYRNTMTELMKIVDWPELKILQNSLDKVR